MTKKGQILSKLFFFLPSFLSPFLLSLFLSLFLSFFSSSLSLLVGADGRRKMKYKVTLSYPGGDVSVRGAVLTAEGVQEVQDLGTFSFIPQNAWSLALVFASAQLK